MGLGILRKNKTSLWENATKYDYNFINSDQKVAHIIDGNAKVRRLFVGDESPRTLVKSYIKNQILNTPGKLSYVMFACDSGKLIPNIRIDFHKNQRYAPSTNKPNDNQICVNGINYTRGSEPMDDKDVDLIQPDFIPVSWTRVWAHSRGKHKAMDAIVRCFKDELTTLTDSNTTCMIDPPDASELIWKCSPQITNPKYNQCGREVKPTPRIHYFGEADSKVAEDAMRYATAHPDEIVIIDTIDWDMSISGLCLMFPKNVWLQMSLVYANDEGQIEYSGSAGKKLSRMVRKPEMLSPYLLYQKYNPYNTAWYVLCMSGCDYCDGLNAFGFKESSMIDIAITPSLKSFITKSVVDGLRTLSIDVDGMLDNLREIQRVPVSRPAVLTARYKHMNKKGMESKGRYTIKDAIYDFIEVTANPINLRSDYIKLMSTYNLTSTLKKLRPQGVQAAIDKCRKQVLSYEKKNDKYNSVTEFEFELNRIWTCIIYFHGFDPQRPRGGPESQHEQWFQGCSTIDDVINMSHNRIITYVEQYPDYNQRY